MKIGNTMVQQTTSSSDDGARIVGGERNFSGPGPEVMAADTLQGDKVINPQGET
jgi:hypothetical protein